MEFVVGKESPLISVVVPVYNVEAYLDQCLKSICRQTLSQIEIIIIDDGSTDRSGQICDAFAAEDSRIRIIHKKNAGLSAARNDGLALARAEYIMFVDSDDWVEPEFCQAPYRIARDNGADLVAFGFQGVDEKGRIARQRAYPAEGLLSREDALIKYWPFVSVVVWNKLYRRNLFDGISYPVGHFCEDVAVAHRVIHRAHHIFLLDEMLYNHRVLRSGSITEVRSDQFLRDSAEYNLQRLDDLRAWGYDCSEEEQRLAVSYLAQYGMHQEKSPAFAEILRECRRFTRNTSWRQKVMFRVFRISPALFDLIAILTGRRYR